MISIKSTLNYNFEAYVFILRTISDEARYHKSAQPAIKESIDRLYDDSTVLFEHLFDDKPMIKALFYDLNETRNIMSLLPYFYCLDADTADQTPQVMMRKYLEDLYHKTTDEYPDDTLSVFHIVHTLEISATEKWLLLDLTENIHQYFPQYVSLMNTVIAYLKPYLKQFSHALDDFKEEWETIQNTQGFALYFSEHYGFSVSEGEFEVIYPSVIGMNQGVFLNKYIYLGIFLNDNIDHRPTMTFEQACKVLKLLGDPSKSTIMRLLHKKTMYGKEIANETGLTPATISYHMQELLNEDVLTVSTDASSNRLYYQLNQETLLSALSFIEDYFQ